MPGNKCTNCITFRTHCTHLYISKGSSSSLNYKNSREHVAAILSQTTAYVPSNDPTVLCQILVEIARYARNLEELLALSASPSTDLFSSSESRLSFPPQDNIATTVDNKQEDSNDGVFVDIGITDPLRRLALPFPISEADENYRYYGKSSNMNFMKAAMAYIDNPGGAYTFDAQRPEFWIIQPWQQPLPESPPPQFFPNDELLQNFIDIYFRHINSLIFFYTLQASAPRLQTGSI
ncbi:hypothetical protein B0H17DRAFT_391567 [Mycena rosella]|uniref:Uncharacterized protein n=1 Tax=Mycena rosella TaxID=1033263 RepID=A0AAD7GIU2_MYCRO|nr:hypothetical protein B0H17DRAFT_391567 [Mycena rosella]